MFDVALSWERCPDGVEIHHYGGETEPAELPSRAPDFGKLLTADWAPKKIGDYYRVRSARRTPMRCEAVDLEDPVALKFINCTDDTSLAAFLGWHGMLSDVSELAWSQVESARLLLQSLAEVCVNGEAAEKSMKLNGVLLKQMKLRPEFDFSGKGQKGRIAFYANDLREFMCAEIAIAVINDVRLVRCANCNSAFFTGAAAHRRADTKTCSVKCRVALGRKRAEAIGSA